MTVTVPPAELEAAERYLRSATLDDISLQFVRALAEADAFNGDISNVLYFLDKPWKWAKEYAVWGANGRPNDDSEPGWEAFQAAVDSVD